MAALDNHHRYPRRFPRRQDCKGPRHGNFDGPAHWNRRLNLGGWIFTLLGLAAYGLIGQLVMATVGAVVLLLIVRAIKKIIAIKFRPPPSSQTAPVAQALLPVRRYLRQSHNNSSRVTIATSSPRPRSLPTTTRTLQNSPLLHTLIRRCPNPPPKQSPSASPAPAAQSTPKPSSAFLDADTRVSHVYLVTTEAGLQARLDRAEHRGHRRKKNSRLTPNRHARKKNRIPPRIRTSAQPSPQAAP